MKPDTDAAGPAPTNFGRGARVMLSLIIAYWRAGGSFKALLAWRDCEFAGWYERADRGEKIPPLPPIERG
jgi:hypothetical protein